MGTPYTYRVNPNGIFEAVNCRQYKTPFTASLNSTSSNRKIEVSIDDGDSWMEATIDYDTPETIGVVINAPVSRIRFTGDNDDTVRIIAA